MVGKSAFIPSHQSRYPPASSNASASPSTRFASVRNCCGRSLTATKRLRAKRSYRALRLRRTAIAARPVAKRRAVEGSGTSVIVAVEARPNVLFRIVPSRSTPVNVPAVAVIFPNGKLKPLPKTLIVPESKAKRSPPIEPPEIFITESFSA